MILKRMIAAALTSILMVGASGHVLSQDYVVDASGAPVTETGEQGDTGPYGVAPGDRGGDGENGGEGSRGNDGDDRSIVVDVPVAGNVVISSNGSKGGAGGRGGDGQQGVWGAAVGITGGAGGDGGKGGAGGAGGNGGSIVVAIDSTVSGDVTISAQAGAGGDGGNGGNGGPGNEGYPAALGSNGAAGGSGGNGHVGGRGGDGGPCATPICTPGLVSGAGGQGGDGVVTAGTGGDAGEIPEGYTAGQAGPDGNILTVDTFTGARGVDGEAGTIDVTVNAVVGGDIMLSAADIAVVINEGGEVGGVISAAGAATSSLTFRLDVLDPTDFANASALLAGNTASGTISVDGRTYQWSGFTDLINQMQLLEITEVTISVSSSPSTLDTPVYLRCKPRTVRAFVVDGAITITARRPDGMAGSFKVGTLIGSAFTSANLLGWSAELTTEAKRTVVLVRDGAGATVATCRR